MTIWQKITDATSSLASGDSVRSTLRSLADQLGFSCSSGEAPADSAGVTIALIALSAKMAKADGVVLPIEVEVFNRIMLVPEGEARNVKRVFDLAKADVAGYEVYAERIGRLLANDRPLRQAVLEALFHVGTADRALHPKEDEYLAVVSDHLGFSRSEYLHFRGRFVRSIDQSPYSVLGLEPTASDEEVRQRYLHLARKNHPDVLSAQSVPAEFLVVATRKMQAINEAYRTIVGERGL